MERLTAKEASRYLTDPLVDYPSRRGKGLRPALCMATCEAFGGSIEEALVTAIAIEMLHNAFLVHDDVQDDSELRRGEPSLHRKYGSALAINAGDALALAAIGVLRDNMDLLGHRVAQAILGEFDFMSRHTVDGQALELGWRMENRLDLVPADYLDMIMKKTCWYTTILPLRAGALIGSRLQADLSPMVDFGFYLGAAFQIQDDLLSLTGDEGLYGKKTMEDIAEGKRTLPLIHLLSEADEGERNWLKGFLGSEREARSPDDVHRVARLMDAHGSIEFARHFAYGVASSAEGAFERAFRGVAPGQGRSFVHDLIPYMIERDL